MQKFNQRMQDNYNFMGNLFHLINDKREISGDLYSTLKKTHGMLFYGFVNEYNVSKNWIEYYA